MYLTLVLVLERCLLISQLTNYGYNINMVIKSHLVSLSKTLPFSWYGLIGTDHRAVGNWKKRLGWAYR